MPGPARATIVSITLQLEKVSRTVRPKYSSNIQKTVSLKWENTGSPHRSREDRMSAKSASSFTTITSTSMSAIATATQTSGIVVLDRARVEQGHDGPRPPSRTGSGQGRADRVWRACR